MKGVVHIMHAIEGYLTFCGHDGGRDFFYGCELDNPDVVAFTCLGCLAVAPKVSCDKSNPCVRCRVGVMMRNP